MDHLVHLIKHCKMALLSVAILIVSLFSSSITVLATTPTDAGAGQVKVTGLTIDKHEVRNNGYVNVAVAFQGGANVQPGTALTINLPQNTTNVAGLHGVRGKQAINATYNGNTIDNVATAEVSQDKVVITFNDHVKQLPNGFVGNFRFNAVAEAAINSKDKVTPATITVDGQSVSINVTNNSTPVGPGVSSQKPIDTSKTYFNKGGYFGKDGNINWGINGSIPDANTGDIVITDTPSGPATKINQASWSIAIKSANGYTDKFSVDRAQKELRAKITFDDKGGFTCVIPADVLRNTVWHIQYNSQTIETPTNGDTFDNHATVSYNNKTQTADKQISFKQNMSGDIVGFDTGKLTLQKQDGLTKVALPGAQFSLYKDGTALKTAVTDNTGKLVFTGLTDGNYTLKETKAPNGYQLPKDEYHFTVSQGKLVNSNLPKNYILKNYKTASSSSSSGSLSKKSSSSKDSSSKKSSSVKSSSSKKLGSSKVSSVKNSSSSKKISSVKSSSSKKSSSSSKKSSSLKKSSSNVKASSSM